MTITAHDARCLISGLDDVRCYINESEEKIKLIESENESLKEKVKELVFKYGGINGDHHKQWLIDQIIRAVFGDNGYQHFLEEYNTDVDPWGEPYEKWDEGIAP